VNARARRRRAALLLALAVACGGIAASRVHGRATELERRIGPLVPVVMARVDIPLGTRVSAGMLAVRQVPQRFAPADSLPSPAQAVGRPIGAPVAAGGYLTDGAFAAAESERDSQAPVDGGERAIEIAVAGGEALMDAPPGTHVDVFVTDERRTYLALQNVELIAARAAPADRGLDGAAAHATALATVRVTLRQAVYLTAAEGFAREVRLLARAPGDHRNAPPLAVDGRRL
jgi:pilus assembly protein CpaB